MTPEEQKAIDLNAPAFGSGAQKVADLTQAPADSEDKQEDAVVTPSDDEGKVPYSRFKKFHDEAKQYQQEAEYWRQQAQTYKPTREENTGEDRLQKAKELWIETYGGDANSLKGWENQVKINQALREDAIALAREEARETFRNERFAEVQRTQENIQTIDGELETLQDYVGRNLTEREEEAILDIVDTFTPKDREGNYAGALLPMDKAWEIYELQQGASKSGRRSSRDSVAQLSGSQSQGNSDVQSEQDKNFNPRDWDAYKRRLQG